MQEWIQLQSIVWQLQWQDRVESVLSTKICLLRQQAEEVDKVKRSENGVITDPFYLSPEHTLEDANDLMAKFRISGVPITEGKKLVGIITNRDLKFETDFSKKIKECMTSEGLDHSAGGYYTGQRQRRSLPKPEKRNFLL